MKALVADTFVLGGLSLVAYGVSLLWLPGGWIIGGFALVVLALSAARA